MEDYINKYDGFNKIIVYNFKHASGGIGDCIKFFMYLLKLCMQHNIKLYYLVNNTMLEKYLKLKYDKMYITQSSIVDARNISANDIPNLTVDICNIVDPGIFYNIYNDDHIPTPINEVFTFSDEVKINSVKLNVDNISNYISVHLRLGDKYLETDNAFIYCKYDVRVYNEERLFHFIENNRDKNIIFFCDNHAYKLKIKNKYNNISIITCHIGHTCLSNTTDEQTLDAITEFYLMAESEKIYSASNSGFSIMSSKFKNIPIIRI
jgi:hypothetical protein